MPPPPPPPCSFLPIIHLPPTHTSILSFDRYKLNIYAISISHLPRKLETRRTKSLRVRVPLHTPTTKPTAVARYASLSMLFINV